MFIYWRVVCWRVCVLGEGGRWERRRNEGDLDWRMEVKGAGAGGNKHLEVTQVDSALVCSLYQWGPGPWALGVYLSSWGTTAHYSPPIMPHRAPFLCLNWGAVCAPMNYSIYLLWALWGLFRETAPNIQMPTCAFPHLRKLGGLFSLSPDSFGAFWSNWFWVSWYLQNDLV